MMRLASVPGDVEVCPGRSSFQQHDVLLMGSKFEDSSSIRESTGSFILDLLHCGDGGESGDGSDGRRRRRAPDAPLLNLCVISFSFRDTWSGGLVVRVLYK